MPLNLENALNPAQIEAVTTLGYPLLVIAGAGSGKTRVITYRIAYLIEQGIPPWKILAVTFTNKAAGEMDSRVQQLLGQNLKINVGTFHSICVRILRKEIEQVGIRSNFLIYDQSDQLTLVKQVCKELNVSDKLYKPQAIQSRISAAKNQLLTASLFRSQVSDYFDQVVSKIYDQYEKRIRSNHAVDFDDIILHTVFIFQKFPEVLAKYQDRFQHILVDEYQDTNHAQYRLIQLLAKDGHNLCIVGDPDQSIYRWRGADIRNILRFEEDYAGVKTVRLEQNYRSTQNILSAANKVIANNLERKPKNLWSKNESGDPIYIYTGNDEQSEANFVVNIIEELRRNQKMKYSDMVVFYRTHAQSRVIEESMRFGGIPYEIVGGVSFYERREVKDIIAYLNLLVSPDDEISMRRIINVPTRGIGDSALDAIADMAKKQNRTFSQVVFDALNFDLNIRAQDKIKNFVLLIQDLQKLAKELSLPDLIRKVIEQTKYFDELKKEEKVIAETRMDNVKELVSAAEDFTLSRSGGLVEFLEGINLVSAIDRWKDETDKLTLMTLHSAKGLEFDVVLMTGMEEGIFPHSISSSDIEELEEERRLCYVGMTRAKKKLLMTHVTCRMLYGKRSFSVPSRFLQEIPHSLKKAVTNLGVQDVEDPISFSEEPEKSVQYAIGQNILHPKFGKGQILEVEYYGDDAKLQVMFKDQVRWLSSGFVKLTILN